MNGTRTSFSFDFVPNLCQAKGTQYFEIQQKYNRVFGRYEGFVLHKKQDHQLCNVLDIVNFFGNASKQVVSS